MKKILGWFLLIMLFLLCGYIPCLKVKPEFFAAKAYRKCFAGESATLSPALKTKRRAVDVYNYSLKNEEGELFFAKLVYTDEQGQIQELRIIANRRHDPRILALQDQRAIELGMEMLESGSYVNARENCATAVLRRLFPALGFTPMDWVYAHIGDLVGGVELLCQEKRIISMTGKGAYITGKIEKGDILVFYDENYEPSHMALVDGFDEQGRPLLYQKISSSSYVRGTLEQTLEVFHNRIRKIRVFKPQEGLELRGELERSA